MCYEQLKINSIIQEITFILIKLFVRPENFIDYVPNYIQVI